jgi:agmatine deiminase
MITDIETNFVYFSSLIKENLKYKLFWNRLRKSLDKENIDYGFINGTRDIWCRDYMPIQLSKNNFVQFKFFPDYYLSPDFIHKLTIPSETVISMEFYKSFSKLIIDGGNIIKYQNRVILTDKIFKENPEYFKSEIISQLKIDLKIDTINIIPAEKEEISGHADGMVKIFSEKELLVGDYSNQDKHWKSIYYKSLKETGYNLISFPSAFIEEKNDDGDYTAIGCYINFVQIGNKILLPFFNLAEDIIVEKQMKKLYPDCKIIPIESNEIAQDGGVLNCITWNIQL